MCTMTGNHRQQDSCTNTPPRSNSYPDRSTLPPNTGSTTDGTTFLDRGHQQQQQQQQQCPHQQSSQGPASSSFPISVIRPIPIRPCDYRSYSSLSPTGCTLDEVDDEDDNGTDNENATTATNTTNDDDDDDAMKDTENVSGYSTDKPDKPDTTFEENGVEPRKTTTTSSSSPNSSPSLSATNVLEVEDGLLLVRAPNPSPRPFSLPDINEEQYNDDDDVSYSTNKTTTTTQGSSTVDTMNTGESSNLLLRNHPGIFIPMVVKPVPIRIQPSAIRMGSLSSSTMDVSLHQIDMVVGKFVAASWKQTQSFEEPKPDGSPKLFGSPITAKHHQPPLVARPIPLRVHEVVDDALLLFPTHNDDDDDDNDDEEQNDDNNEEYQIMNQTDEENDINIDNAYRHQDTNYTEAATTASRMYYDEGNSNDEVEYMNYNESNYEANSSNYILNKPCHNHHQQISSTRPPPHHHQQQRSYQEHHSTYESVTQSHCHYLLQQQQYPQQYTTSSNNVTTHRTSSATTKITTAVTSTTTSMISPKRSSNTTAAT